jgi:hypothetical protein
MRKYTLTAEAMRKISDRDKQRIMDWCKAEGAPNANTILSIDLFPDSKQVTYHLVTGLDSTGLNFTTLPFTLPIKNRPDWVGLCKVTEMSA